MQDCTLGTERFDFKGGSSPAAGPLPTMQGWDIPRVLSLKVLQVVERVVLPQLLDLSLGHRVPASELHAEDFAGRELPADLLRALLGLGALPRLLRLSVNALNLSRSGGTLLAEFG